MSLPNAGRVISEWLDESIELHDADGDTIGEVLEINPDFIVAKASAGFLGLGEPKLYFIPATAVTQVEGAGWRVSVDKDDIEQWGWLEPPQGSTWSTDWVEGRLTVDQNPGHTRLRRVEQTAFVPETPRVF